MIGQDQGGAARLGDTTVRPLVPGRDRRLLVASVGYVAAIVVSALTASAASSVTGDTDGAATMLAGQVGFWVVLVTTYLYARRQRAGALSDRVALRFRWTDLPVGAVIGAATQLVLVPALYLPVGRLIDDDQLSRPARDVFDRLHGTGLIAIAVGVIVVAPVVEELFFRGLVFGAMRRRWGTVAAVTGSSVVFGATHFQPLQFPALALAGAVFATAAVRSGRLGPAVAAHAAFNATTFVALVLIG